MNIPIFKLEYDNKFIDTFKNKCAEILTSNRQISESYYVKEYEEKFSDLINCKYATAVSSGTAAIDLALRALNIKGKVLIPSNTFFATSIAVENSGCQIVLADCEKDSFSLCPKSLEKQINIQKIDAVIIVHIGGIISPNILEIVDICKKHRIPLIEDSAHAHLSTRKNLSAGSIGDIGCFSFFPTKVMTTGEGGMITTNNENIYKEIQSLKNFGRDNDDYSFCIKARGFNYKINEFTGLLGSMECDRVLRRIQKRNKLLTRYITNLAGTNYKPIIQDDGFCSYYKFILMIPGNRELVREYCRKNRIMLTGEVYKHPIHKQPIYKNLFENEAFPITDIISQKHICPPLYPELEIDDIDYVSEILIKANNITINNS
jgi:perosamine synthetase